METSVRYDADTKSLRIYSKENFPIGANTLCQISGELGTQNFYPEGLWWDKVHYKIRGKKAFPVNSDELMNFNIKGGCHIEEKFREINYSGAAEFVWNIFYVKKDQDFRLKFGYNVPTKFSSESME